MFIYSNPIEPDSFVGRARELGEVATRIAFRGQSTAVIGEPRSGKTSLLKYLVSPSGAEYVQRLSDTTLLFVYLDAHSLSAETVHLELWGAVLDALAQGQPEVKEQLPSLVAQTVTLSSVKRSVESALLRAYALRQRVVVLIDEFDVLVHQRLPDNNQFFGTLRSLASLSGGSLALVVASRTPLDELDAHTRNHGSPYFNFISEVYLAPLNIDEVGQVLQRGARPFSVDEHHSIYELSGGFPYFVQASAAALEQAYAEHTSAEARARAAQAVVQRETARTIADIWARWSAPTQHAFAILAIKHLASLHQVSAGEPSLRELFDSEVDEPECRRLVRSGFVKVDEDGGSVQPLLLLAWFVNQHRSLAGSDRSWTKWLFAQEWFVEAPGAVQTMWREYAPRLLRAATVRLYTVDDCDRGVRIESDFVARETRHSSEVSAPAQVSPRTPVTVFVSYAHDSEAHKSWVLQLSRLLLKNGINVTLDRWHLRLGQDLSAFMERNIREAQRVLIVCSSNYVLRANDNRGGVDYERLVVAREIVSNTQTTKFIPILRNNPEKELPAFLGARNYLDFDDDTQFEVNFQQLLWELHDRWMQDKPTLGDPPVF